MMNSLQNVYASSTLVLDKYSNVVHYWEHFFEEILNSGASSQSREDAKEMCSMTSHLATVQKLVAKSAEHSSTVQRMQDTLINLRTPAFYKSVSSSIYWSEQLWYWGRCLGPIFLYILARTAQYLYENK